MDIERRSGEVADAIDGISGERKAECGSPTGWDGNVGGVKEWTERLNFDMLNPY